MSGDAWIGDVLAFWFEELAPKDWFTKRDATDDLIRARFVGIHADVRARSGVDLASDPDRALAAILVTDQFPRNMFRGTPESFASDALALDIARRVVAHGFDRDFETQRRIFLYLPFEHSEDMADQDEAVRLITALGDAEFTRYAEAHRDVIRRFGRFPHRNAALGRPSTELERAFLTQPGSSF